MEFVPDQFFGRLQKETLVFSGANGVMQGIGWLRRVEEESTVARGLRSVLSEILPGFVMCGNYWNLSELGDARLAIFKNMVRYDWLERLLR